jgi:hypothetical protein
MVKNHQNCMWLVSKTENKTHRCFGQMPDCLYQGNPFEPELFFWKLRLRTMSDCWIFEINEYKIQCSEVRSSQIMKSWNSAWFLALTWLRITPFCIWICEWMEKRPWRNRFFDRRKMHDIQVLDQGSWHTCLFLSACEIFTNYLISLNFFNMRAHNLRILEEGASR